MFVRMIAVAVWWSSPISAIWSLPDFNRGRRTTVLKVGLCRVEAALRGCLVSWLICSVLPASAEAAPQPT